jgi:GntR family L-lactate dehydrogenase operon transcriptional regulator
MGVIETRVGAGSYVRETADRAIGAMSSDIADEIACAISKSEEALQLQEARAVFESGMARLVSTRWTPAWEERFRVLLAEMGSAASGEQYNEFIRLHRDFHLLLAEATENAIVVSTARSFLAFMDHEGWQAMERQFYLPNRREVLAESVEMHRGIVEALAVGDGALASERMHDHFEHYEHESAEDEPREGV